MAMKRPTIGIFLGKLIDEYDSLIWSGYMDGIREQEVNVISFIGTGLTDRGSPQTLALVREQLVNLQMLDGMILQTGVLIARFGTRVVNQLFERFHAALPVISMSIRLQKEPCLIIDNYANMAALVEHLIVEHAMQRIAFVRGPAGHNEADVRFRAYADTLDKHGISFDPALICDGDLFYSGGVKAVQQYYDSLPLEIEAIVAANDTMAKAVIEELKLRGIAVPSDVAVTGFDNVMDAQHLSPSLTTVHQPIREQGKVAIEQMMGWLTDGVDVQTTAVPTELVIRASCGCERGLQSLALDRENDDWIIKMAQSVLKIDMNGRRIMQAHSWAHLANAIDLIASEHGLAFCYIFTWVDSADVSHAKLRCGTDRDGILLGDSITEYFPTSELLPPTLWAKHDRFNMIVEPLHFEDEMLGYVVFDGHLQEGWLYESLRAQISNMFKTLSLLEERQSYADKLEQQVAARTAELEALLQERSEWLRIAAHDLRDPLANIRLTTGILAHQKHNLPPEKLAERLDRIDRSVQTMNGIIGRFLTLGSVGTDHIAVTPSQYDISQLLDEVVERQSLYAMQKNITLILDNNASIHGIVDGELLTQIVTNLLSNAIKYSHRGKTVRVRLYRQSHLVYIVVADEGLGFTVEDQANLYQQYTPLSAKPTQGEQSVGLGLFIVKKLVDALGGTIALASQGRNLGSTFTVCIPLQRD